MTVTYELSKALYYPDINIKDVGWLRSALLWLDKIYTIAPNQEAHVKEPVSSEIYQLKEESIIQLSPNQMLNAR